MILTFFKHLNLLQAKFSCTQRNQLFSSRTQKCWQNKTIKNHKCIRIGHTMWCTSGVLIGHTNEMFLFLFFWFRFSCECVYACSREGIERKWHVFYSVQLDDCRFSPQIRKQLSNHLSGNNWKKRKKTKMKQAETINGKKFQLETIK